MSRRKKQHDKFVLVKRHRKNQYLHALDQYFDGKVPIDYVTTRWQKLKALPK